MRPIVKLQTMNASAKAASIPQSRGELTRRKILDATFELILKHGVTVVTVDRVLVKSGTTKGAFFHHFASKNALILALVQHYAEVAKNTLHVRLAEVERISDDPLQQILAFHRQCIILAESAAGSSGLPAHNLFACIAFELENHTPEVRETLRHSMQYLRIALESKLRQAAARHPPRIPVDIGALAELMYAAYYGGLVLGRVMGDPLARARQLRQVQDHLYLLFDTAT